VQSRRPAGTPVGGQFAPSWHPEASGIELVDDDFFELTEPDDDPVTGLAPAGPLDEPEPAALPACSPANILPFGLDADAITSARALVLAARTEVEEARRIDPETWQAAEAAVTAAGRTLASAVDAEVARRHPKGFPVDPDAPCHDYGPEIAAYRDATLEVLGAVRPLGLPDGVQLKTVDSQRPAVAVLGEVSARLPAEWLAASQEKDPPLRARVSPHRAHYSPSRSYFVDEGTQLREVRYTVHDERNVPAGVEATTTSLGYWTWTAMEPRRVRARRRSAELTVPSPNTRPEEARKTATHELTHRCEHANKQLGMLEDAFLRRRCSDEDGRLRPTRPIEHMRGERARDGGFVSPYVGKVYPTQTFHEVLSTGTEAIFGGAYGGLVGRGGEAVDADHRAFVLGCLAAA
jgi:hypothetical protein